MANDAIQTSKPRARKAAAPRASAARKTTGKAATVALSAATPLEGEIVGAVETVAAVDKRPTVMLKGRAMAVQMPAGEQIDIILETYDELANLSQAEVDALSEEEETKLNKRARRLLTRARLGAMVVLADEDDREWVTDEMLRGRITLNDVAALLPQAVAKLAPARKAPATGPAPKARRR